MARPKKKTIVQEFKELIDATPKASTISDSDIAVLREIEEGIADVRRGLDDLKGEENISDIMFVVGSAFQIMDKCEDKLNAILDQFKKEDEEDNW